MVLDMSGRHGSSNPGKPWKWILVDSVIVGVIAFVSTLPTTHLPSTVDYYVAVKAFTYSFFTQLAIEKGIKPYRNGSSRGSNGR